MKTNIITLSHGNGGKQTHELIDNVFRPFFSNPYLKNLDGALVSLPQNRIVVSVDSFVVKPIFFRGGNIGKLSITGTINDLACMGAKPLFISAGFILEEGLEIEKLKEILFSMAEEIQRHQIFFIAGDTKVVPKGEMDSLFITTTGIGVLLDYPPLGLDQVEEGDVVLLSGNVGEHGATIYLERNQLEIATNLSSDCDSIYFQVEAVLRECKNVKVIRDPTRGGLATVLNEFVKYQNWGIEIYENEIPIKDEVHGICDLLGIDVMHLASEGRFVMIIPEKETKKALEVLRSFPETKEANVIGRVTHKYPSQVVMHTRIGGKRILSMLSHELLPRIC
ncbi:MAG: hydrogenase expression/formation protein HypE [Leptospiraceae bacterium]|nr:hydrogenase expression/formation protein HypE [Leptospiraceae bacterium]MDW7976344.1 hydrogenase expression/formation protein HypE [Leptospiraceae bacterium]